MPSKAHQGPPKLPVLRESQRGEREDHDATMHTVGACAVDESVVKLVVFPF
jgi:hypothetical protein